MECPPVVNPPKYVYHDCYIPRMVPHIHPVIHVNRYNIVNVPQHFYPQEVKNVVVDPGCPNCPPKR